MSKYVLPHPCGSQRATSRSMFSNSTRCIEGSNLGCVAWQQVPVTIKPSFFFFCHVVLAVLKLMTTLLPRFLNTGTMCMNYNAIWTMLGIMPGLYAC